ncbi:hypothetical protein [Oceanicella sp. SM1341]|uniref:hypothetical protein n=1 Tax=Oceanicella sp. SM1341 TaxID=1548889 RepID=UPI000E46A703|nr:hypothetical protein [Oceanicella sp. SM1341]
MASREWVTCPHCSGTGTDPFAPRPAAARKASGEPRPPAGRTRQDAAAAQDSPAWLTLVTAGVTAGWALFFLAPGFGPGPIDDWAPLALAGLAGLAGALLWRLAARVVLFCGVFLLAWGWLRAEAGFDAAWVAPALGLVAALVALRAWQVAAMLMLAAAGFVLLLATQDGLSPEQVRGMAAGLVDRLLRPLGGG